MAGIDLSSITTLVEGLVMLDTVRIAEPGTGEPVFDPGTGEYTYPEPVVVYEGPGAVQSVGTPGGITSDPLSGQPWIGETRSRYQLLTPIAAPAPQLDQVVTVVAVHQPGGDSALIGRSWRCQDPGRAGTLSVARVTPLDQVQQVGG